MVPTTYTFANSPEEIRLLLSQKPQYEAILRRAERESLYARTHFCDTAERLCGWGHDFTCPACSSRLTFDIDLDFHPPHTYTCPRCGQSVTGPKADGAWIYYWRERYAAMTESAAICALLGDGEALTYLIRFVDFYADHYLEFPVHGENAGVGRITSQSLDEAVWGMWVLRAIAALGARIPFEKKAAWYEHLFSPMVELLFPQANEIHNIPMWLVCFTGMVGIAFEKPALLEEALESRFGIRAQIAEGFTADGLWHEGSITYHYGTLNALTYFCQMYAAARPDDPITDALARLYLTPLSLAWDGVTPPSLNDGFYPAVVSSNIAIAARITDDPRLYAAVARLDEASQKRRMIPATLLYERPAETVRVLAASRLAILKAPFPALLKSGPISPSHAHRDHLSITLSPFSDDLGTPLYASPLLFDWYRNSPSHNTVHVDGMQPAPVLPSHVEAVPGGARAVIEPGAWPDVTEAHRTLTSDGAAICDVTVLTAETPHVYDWLFHSIGTPFLSGAESEASPLWETPGFPRFTEIRRHTPEMPGAPFTARFTLPDGKSLTLTVADTAELEIFTAQTPGNPADTRRTTVVLRRRGLGACFKVRYTES